MPRLPRPTTLQQKAFLFLLLPIFLFLLLMGAAGLKLVGNVLLHQWQETAIAKLQRSAHHVDMRLMRPKELLRFLVQEKSREISQEEYQLVLDQLKMQDGVVAVKYKSYDIPDDMDDPVDLMGHLTNDRTMHHLQQLRVAPPKFNREVMSETLSIIATFSDQNDKPVGYIEVIMSFYDLVDQIVKAPWWKSNRAYLVDDTGQILTSTDLQRLPGQDKDYFSTQGELETSTWNAMQENIFGTVFGPGIPPATVSGFYRLTEAPWTMVIIAPGKAVLSPILKFRDYYFLIGTFTVLIALSYIRLIIGRITYAIGLVSKAANNLAEGTFEKPLKESGQDEIAKLNRSFNIMASQLQERLALKQQMNIAREVQQTLLPHTSYTAKGFEIAGLSIYCQQTGGDYFDLLPHRGDPHKATVVVGDVVGHGIGAALIMASVRAFLRSRSSQPGHSEEIIGDVNKLLCQDTVHSGNFATLFYLTIDRQRKTLKWIRCGHDPAFLYSVDTNTFSELRGEGLVLGFDKSWAFQENSTTFVSNKQIVLIGSDGVWDAENGNGERFGKERVRKVIANYHDLSAEQIIEKITEDIAIFVDGNPQNDDITLTVIKTY